MHAFHVVEHLRESIELSGDRRHAFEQVRLSGEERGIRLPVFSMREESRMNSIEILSLPEFATIVCCVEQTFNRFVNELGLPLNC